MRGTHQDTPIKPTRGREHCLETTCGFNQNLKLRLEAITSTTVGIASKKHQVTKPVAHKEGTSTTKGVSKSHPGEAREHNTIYKGE
jgi:hypothetical protein